MSASLILIEMAGAVALLLWATRLVQNGVQRAFGHVLKDVLRKALGSPFGAAAAGAGLAMALQSATAVAVIVTGFVGAGFVSVVRGITALLGADLGSAVVALVLRLDLSLLMPVLLLVGLILYRRATGGQGTARGKEIAKILLGIGLILLSLRLIGNAAAPLRDSALLPAALGFLADDWLSAFLLAALFTLLLHSSIAAVLVLAAMAQQGLMPTALLLPLVLGVNAGAAIIPWYLMRGQDVLARQVPLANLVLRGGGAVLGLIVLLTLQPGPDELAFVIGPEADGAKFVIMHVALNGALLFAGMVLATPLARGLQLVLRQSAASANAALEKRPSSLNETDLGMPTVALANAQREMTVICGLIESMLGHLPDLYNTPKPEVLNALRELDDEVDALHTEIKLYVARIPSDVMDMSETARADEILSATIKLEQISDIITRNLLTKAEKKSGRGVHFSDEGWAEITSIHAEVMINARRAYAALFSGDIEMARLLVRSKQHLRCLEQQSEANHLSRLRAGDVQARETSTMHVDTIRDLKEINSLFVAVTYPMLEREGLLSSSRLVE